MIGCKDGSTGPKTSAKHPLNGNLNHDLQSDLKGFTRQKMLQRNCSYIVYSILKTQFELLTEAKQIDEIHNILLFTPLEPGAHFFNQSFT